MIAFLKPAFSNGFCQSSIPIRTYGRQRVGVADCGDFGPAEGAGVEAVFREALLCERDAVGAGEYDPVEVPDEAKSPAGACRVKGLAVVYASTFATWLRDGSGDKSKTKAELHPNLGPA